MADHIQIGDVSPRIQYTGDGVQTVFTYPFAIFADADMEVYQEATLKTLVTDYTVAGAGDSGGGAVTFVAAPANAQVVTLRRNMTLARTSDFQESGEFRAKVINDELDILTALLQQIDENAARALHTGPTDDSVATELPDVAARASKFLAFDGNGLPMASGGSVDSLAVSAFMATLIDDADAASARATLGLTIATDVLAPGGDGSNLTGIAIGATDAEKANIALNAFRIAVNGGLSVQNMVDGVSDEFEDETGVDTGSSTNQTYDATDDYYHNAGAPVQIAQGTGSVVGNLTNGGGNAAAFDGVTVQTEANAAQHISSDPGYIGKDWGSGVTKTVTKFIAYGTSGGGFSRAGAATVTLKLLGHSSDAPGSATVLYTSTSFTDAAGNIKTYESGIDTSSAYRYHWLQIDRTGGSFSGTSAAEVEFFEAGSAPDMTLIANSQTALAQPDDAFLVLWHETVDAVTLDTDLKTWVSRDGGTTWTQAALSLAAALSGNQQILTGSADISGQPAGTSMQWKIETLNNKEQRLRGVSQQWS